MFGYYAQGVTYKVLFFHYWEKFNAYRVLFFNTGKIQSYAATYAPTYPYTVLFFNTGEIQYIQGFIFQYWENSIQYILFPDALASMSVAQTVSLIRDARTKSQLQVHAPAGHRLHGC